MLMKYLLLVAGLACLLACRQKKHPVIRMETAAGNIRIELYPEKAPVTAANFMKLVEEGVYSNVCFYRVVRMNNQPGNAIKIEVIQGGLKHDSLIAAFAPIAHETTEQTGLRHVDGAFSMARNEPGTASTEFFVCIGDQPELDFGGKRNPDGQGFAAFGKVIEGMDVVRLIQQGKDDRQMLLNEVRIFRMVLE